MVFSCSYPTYEEWKPSSKVSFFKLFPSVLILPMRNGNYIRLFIFAFCFNSSYPTYEEWKPIAATVVDDSHSQFLSYL